jgi:hypothetical protein
LEASGTASYWSSQEAATKKKSFADGYDVITASVALTSQTKRM